jgi:hypothetical protein
VSDAANESLVHRFYEELWNDCRLEVADEIVSATVAFRGSLGSDARGRDAFKRYVEGVRRAFPDWRNQIDELLVISDRGCREAHLDWHAYRSARADRPEGLSRALRRGGILPYR